MALPRVSPELSPDENVRRFDAAFRAIDDVTASVGNLQTSIDAETNAREASDDAQARALTAAIAEEARAREDGDLASLSAVFHAPHPGLAPLAFATGTLGTIASRPPLNPANAITSAFGPAWRLAGGGIIAPRAAILFDPDAIQIVQARYWRTDDVLDPNNNAIDCGVQWITSDGADAGVTILHRETDLMVQDGPRRLTFRVPSADGDAVPVAAPKNAVAWRPYLSVYGADGSTAIGMLGVRDATFAGVYAPDVVALAARLSVIEGQLAAGLPLTTPILPARRVADLPKPGNRGRKVFALDGRAPDAAGALEAANAGTGVEVTDNGVAWVISGTNQKVQA